MPIRTRRAAVAGSMGAAGLVWAGIAAAQDAAPIHLAYDVPPGCPSQPQFLDMVGQDGGHVVVVAGDRPAPTFSVHVEGREIVVGRLVVRDADGKEATRKIAVTRCEDVVRSLAVLVALAAQPLPPAEEAPASTAPPEPLPPVPGIAAPDTTPEAPPEPAETDADHVRRSKRRTWHLNVSTEATLDRGVGAGLDPGVAAYLELIDEVPSFYAPSIRAGIELPLDQWTDNTYRRVVGRLDACPWHLVASQPWSDDAFTLTACGRLDVGRLNAQGSTQVNLPWVAPGALLRMRWTSPRFFVELEAGVTFPLVRENFGTGTTDEVPAAAGMGGLGIGVFAL